MTRERYSKQRVKPLLSSLTYCFPDKFLEQRCALIDFDKDRSPTSDWQYSKNDRFRCLCWVSFQLEVSPTRRGVSFLLVLDPLSSPSRCLERIGKVLRLVGNLAIAKLHNADCLRWLLVIAEHVLGDPEIADPKDAPDGEAQLRWVVSAKGLNVVATADSLARLRILDQDVVVIDLVFRFNVPSCGGCPVPIQSYPNFLVFHGVSPFGSYRAILDHEGGTYL